MLRGVTCSVSSTSLPGPCTEVQMPQLSSPSTLCSPPETQPCATCARCAGGFPWVCCPISVHSAFPRALPPTLPARTLPPTWCRNTCCCFCYRAASPPAVREESVRAGRGPTSAARSPGRPLRGPSTLVDDSMSLSSSFRDVMMGMLHTGW